MYKYLWSRGYVWTGCLKKSILMFLKASCWSNILSRWWRHWNRILTREIVGKGVNRKSSPCTFKASSHKSEARESHEIISGGGVSLPGTPDAVPWCCSISPPLVLHFRQRGREKAGGSVNMKVNKWRSASAFEQTQNFFYSLKSWSHISLKKGHGCIIVFTIRKVLCLCLCEIQSIFILFQTTSLCSSDNAPQSSPQMK